MTPQDILQTITTVRQLISKLNSDKDGKDILEKVLKKDGVIPTGYDRSTDTRPPSELNYWDLTPEERQERLDAIQSAAQNTPTDWTINIVNSALQNSTRTAGATAVNYANRLAAALLGMKGTTDRQENMYGKDMFAAGMNAAMQHNLANKEALNGWLNAGANVAQDATDMYNNARDAERSDIRAQVSPTYGSQAVLQNGRESRQQAERRRRFNETNGNKRK